MASYDYRCETDGVFELTLPLGTAPPDAPCPECGEKAVRIFSAPLTTPLTLDRSGPGGMTRIPVPPGARPPGQLPMTAPMRGYAEALTAPPGATLRLLERSNRQGSLAGGGARGMWPGSAGVFNTSFPPRAD